MTKATELRELASLTTISSGQIQFDTDIKISGDLITTGNTITITADTLNISDPNITLASGAANSAIADGAGITIDGADATLTWNDSEQAFAMNNSLYVSTSSSVSTDTNIRIIAPTYPSIEFYSSNTNTGNRNWKLASVYNSFGKFEILSSTAAGSVPGTSRLAIDNTGKVGVSQSSPNAQLHINDGTNNSNIGVEDYPAIQIGNTVNYRFGIYTSSEGAFLENKNGDDGITFLGKYGAGTVKVDKNGNLAVGSSFLGSNYVASYEVDVDGDIQARDSFRTQQVRHSIAPTLNLDFANSKQLDSRITFYRDSIGTYYDSKGVLRYANHNEPRFDHDPATGESKGLLVEEQMTNEITYSVNLGNFAASASHKENLAGVAPDGTYSAVNHVPDTSTSYHNLTWNPSLTAGTPYTFSIYMKYTGGISLVRMSLYDNTNGYTGLAVFDIQNGTIELNSYGIAIIEDAGNGWYRCILVQNSTAFSSNTKYVWINPSNSSGTTQAENGTDGYLLWGPQVEKAIFHTSYIPSDTRFTSRSSVATYHDENGILRKAPVNVPRYGYKYDGYNWVETGLMLESSASNVLGSQDLSTFVLETGIASVEKDYSVVAPDGSPSYKITATSGTIEGHWIRSNFTENSGYGYTLSVYAKAGTGRYLAYNLGASRLAGVWDLQDGVVIVEQHNGSYFYNHKAYIENVGNGWWRCSISGQSINGQGNYIRIGLSNGSGEYQPSYDGNGDYIYLFGPVIEERSSGITTQPTSFIYGGSTTRSADVATGVAITREDDVAQITNENFDFYNLKEGTTYVEAYPNASAAPQYAPTTFAYWDGVGTDDRINMRFSGSFDAGTLELQAAVESFDSGLNSFYNPTTTGTGTRGTLFKGAISMSDNNFIATTQGDASVGTLTSQIMPDVKQLTIGSSFSNSYQLNGHVKKLAYYDQQLTSAELIALTEND